jgi:hypothetical protein
MLADCSPIHETFLVSPGLDNLRDRSGTAAMAYRQNYSKNRLTTWHVGCDTRCCHLPGVLGASHMKRISLVVALLALVALSWPSAAFAQRRGRGPSRVVVVGAPYFYDPFYSPFYSPWFGPHWGYPYPYGGYRLAREASIRLEVEPRNASVFVDGYFAGTVDNFDGVFQRLHVDPGVHEIVVYLEGYRSIRERLYIGPNSSRKITREMEKLGAGEPNEPKPAPAAEARESEGAAAAQGPPPGPRRRPGPIRRGPDRSPSAVQASRSGTVAIRVQPGDAEILIDGERWAHGSGADDRLIVQLADGPHQIEAQKDGYRPMSVEVEVRRGETAPVNIILSPQ